MSDQALRPYLVRRDAQAPVVPVAAPPVPEVIVRTIERVIEKDAPKPSGWRFDVVRGPDNLIESIIAEPTRD